MANDIAYEVEVPSGKVSEQSIKDLSQGADISSNKPEVENTDTITIEGLVASGTHGGLLTPLAYTEYLAGTRLNDITVSGVVKMQPLKHVTLSKLKLKLFTVFVPNSRVWEDADKFSAQRHDLLSDPIESVPVIPIPAQRNGAVNLTSTPAELTGINSLVLNDPNLPVLSTTLFRESVAYHYFGQPCLRSGRTGFNEYYNALIPRGYLASVNDIFRDRRVQPEVPEYKSSGMNAQEYRDLFIINDANAPEDMRNEALHINRYLRRVPATKNYWNSWRPDVLRNDDVEDTSLLHQSNINSKMISEYRAQAENVNKTDQEIIAEIRGARQSRENVCQIVAQKTIDIDMSVQPATAESNQTTAVPLGAEGAISYTFANITLNCSGFEHTKDGYLHHFYVLSMVDNGIYANAQNIEALKTKWQDFYRPDMKEIKDTPLLLSEIDGTQSTTEIIGWRRTYSEYFRHPNFIRGDFNTDLDVHEWLVGNARFNSTGWLAGPNFRLPSTADWIGVRLLGEHQDLTNNVLDRTDGILRRLMLLDGGTQSDTIYRRTTNQAVYLNAKLSFRLSLPISKSIQRQFIGYGEE